MGMDWIKRVFVAGAGTMGPSIAMVFAQGGHEVDLINLIILKGSDILRLTNFFIFLIILKKCRIYYTTEWCGYKTKGKSF